MNKLRSLIKVFKKYDPKDYWSSRNNPNNKEGETKTLNNHLDYIGFHTASIEKVFELGPGVGRTFDAYEKGTSITGLDITSTYKQIAQKRAVTLGLHFSLEELSDSSSSFPFTDDSFEVGVASQVLLHVPNTDIYDYLSECLRVCEKLVVITAYRHSSKASFFERSSRHVFNHNYFKICTDLGFAMNDVLWRNNQLYCVISKRVV